MRTSEYQITKMKVLLLEPDEYYQTQLLQLLGSDFEVTTARDNRAAEHLFNSTAPDLLVCELMLADGPSFELLEKLRRDRSSSTLPIIVFTQINSLPDIAAALSIGVNGYFVKGRDNLSDVKKLLLNLVLEAQT